MFTLFSPGSHHATQLLCKYTSHLKKTITSIDLYRVSLQVLETLTFWYFLSKNTSKWNEFCTAKNVNKVSRIFCLSRYFQTFLLKKFLSLKLVWTPCIFFNCHLSILYFFVPQFPTLLHSFASHYDKKSILFHTMKVLVVHKTM